MKEIYYYEYSDDGIEWTLGKPAFSLLDCVDKARKCCYSFRITKVELNSLGKFVSFEEIDEALDQLNLLEKIFQ